MVNKFKTYRNFNIFKAHKKSILLIGNFDGLHLGHQKLFNLAKKYKKKLKVNIGVLTFEPIPKMYFNKNLTNFRISSLSQKINLIKKIGVNFLIIKKFDRKFSKTTADNFIKNIIFKKLNPKYIFVSNNFRFGKKRQGDVKQLLLNEKKFSYKIVNSVPHKLQKKITSSTLIRKLISKGYLKHVNKLLSRNWAIEGIVERGRKIGKKIGFPTCNINIKDYVIAQPGVYAVKIHQKNKKKFLKGIANLGYRPTFKQKKLLLEVHIFNFSGNLYNKHLIIEFVNFIRKEKKFENSERLKNQIKLDLYRAKKILY